MIALRLGAFQLLHMDRIPAHAAIDESVELAKQAGHRFASGMVNAVLRKLAQLRRRNFHEDGGRIGGGTAHPAWMVERWAGFYGLDAARAICVMDRVSRRLVARVLGAQLEEELATAGIRLEPGELLTAASQRCFWRHRDLRPFAKGVFGCRMRDRNWWRRLRARELQR